MANKKGVTLIEVLITCTILSAILAAIFLAFASGVNIFNRVSEYGKVKRDMYIGFERIKKDFLNCVSFREVKFEGETGDLLFPVLLREGASGGSTGFVIGVVYFYYDQGRNALYMKKGVYGEDFDLEDLEERVLVTDLENVRFGYYVYNPDLDEYEWLGNWTEEGGRLPLELRVVMDGENEMFLDKVIYRLVL